MYIGFKNKNFRYTTQDVNENYMYTPTETVSSEKVLENTFDSELNFHQHIYIITAKAQRYLELIYKSFEYLDRDMFLPIFKFIVRPLLEYGSSRTDSRIFPLLNKFYVNLGFLP